MALRLAVGCVVAALVSSTYPAAKQPKRYGETKLKFMPSEPGKPPPCLKDPRLTYCEDPDDYPKDRILYLLENNMFDVGTILMDETRDTYTFEAMDAPKPMYNYKPPQQGYLPPVSAPSNKSGGYPTRAPSKYGYPSGEARYIPPHGLGNSSSIGTSSYASYQPQQFNHPPHPPPSTAFGRGLQSPSSQYLSYKQAPRSSSDDNVASSTYPRYPKPSHQSRYTGPRLSPQKSYSWWRK